MPLIYCLLLIWVSDAPAQSKVTAPAIIDDPIAEEFEYLKRQSISKIGRDAIVDGYKKLIARAGGDPRAADAMMAIGNIYGSTTIPEMNIVPDHKEALTWFRKAVDAAPKGSVQWKEAMFRVANIIRWSDAAAARRMLNDIASQFKNHPPTLARVEHDLMATYKPNEIEKAESHARNVLSWYNTPANIPQDLDVKQEVDGLIVSAARAIIAMEGSAQTPIIKRITRIKKLMNDYPFYYFLQVDGDREIARLTALPDDVLQPKKSKRSKVPGISDTSDSRTILPSEEPPAAERTWTQAMDHGWLLIVTVVTGLAILGIIGWMLARRRHPRE